MNFNNAVFEAAFGTSDSMTLSDLPEICFSGRSNVGKSSLINRVLGRKNLAYVSTKPGKTVTINLYKLDNVRLVDLPGYGYAKVSANERGRWADLMDCYFKSGRNIKMVFQLIDMRHEPTAFDLDMIDFLEQMGIPFTVVLTKSDKLNKSEYASSVNRIKSILGNNNFIPFSAVSGEGTEQIRKVIENSAADFMRVKCAAKINLCLSVGEKQADGYHKLDTVMQAVDICDTLTIKKSDSISVIGDASPDGSDNICCKAAECFKNFGGAEIKIEKNIPLSAGLGGGSSDAAGVLLGMNRLYNYPFSAEELNKKARELGSDVPFFLGGGTAYVSGTGENIAAMKPFCAYTVVIKEGQKQSTGEMYGKLDGIKDRTPFNINTITAFESGDINEIASAVKNDFSSVCKKPEVVSDLTDNGAYAAGLSGSGPSVFGLFSDYKTAKKCYLLLKGKYENIFVAKTSDNPITFE